ncbi:MAG: hypothetical protein J4428_00645 [Candidatus Aenigmarchaeota archaeon]|nr:hypothetical protein [Candidatus Aenigmarchaeota archaeon]
MALKDSEKMKCENCSEEPTTSGIACKICGKKLCEKCQKTCERCNDSICNKHSEKRHRIKGGRQTIVMLCEYCEKVFKL